MDRDGLFPVMIRTQRCEGSEGMAVVGNSISGRWKQACGTLFNEVLPFLCDSGITSSHFEIGLGQATRVGTIHCGMGHPLSET